MRTIVLGGAACGKSEYAEALAVILPAPRYYIATMMPFDKEDILRIEKHRAMRAEKGFHTMERYTDLAGLLLPERGTVLLECLGNLTANELFSESGSKSGTFDAIMKGIEMLETQCDDLVVVSNDVFSDGNAYMDETMRYIETLAAINRALGHRYERVAELVCGIPLLHKEAKA
jgi:adenosylcobinamide kinase/adenosylcobinamide-phosphate guanylyltransferase